LVLLAALALLALASGDREARATERYRIGVQGPVEAVEPALAAVRALGDGRLVLEPVDDVPLAVAEHLDAGLVVRPSPDGPPQVELVSDATSTRSRAAASLVRAALYDGAPFDDGPLRVRVGAAAEPRATEALSDADDRRALGRAVAALLLIQASVLVGTAATRMFGQIGRAHV